MKVTRIPANTNIEFFTELATRQYCCDNVTMFSGHKVVVIAILLYLLELLHPVTKTKIFFKFVLVPDALLRCRVVVVAKQKNCRMPSYAFL